MQASRIEEVSLDPMKDQVWRLNNLYYITNKDGKRVKFQMNWAQQVLWEKLWTRDLILKARQLGMSTFIGLLQLDSCVFNDDFTAGTIADNLENAEKLFTRNIKYPYDHLPEAVRTANPARRDRTRELRFANGSSISVGTSMRSGTLQLLHVSEFGKICAKYPHKAREIVTGSFEAVGTNGIIAVESTAEGAAGYFHDYCLQAVRDEDAGKQRTALDWQFFFLPWWKHPEYVMPPKGIKIYPHRREYFEKVEAEIGQKIPPARRAWYVKKAETLGDDMLREYPSTWKEAFHQSIEGAYYERQMRELRKNGRITHVPVEPGVAVETWWDLGMDDATAIWFVQRVGLEIRAVKYIEVEGEGLQSIKYLLDEIAQEKQWTYGRMIGPHDLKVRELGTGVTRLETAQALGMHFEVAPNMLIVDGINAARRMLPNMWLDEDECQEGIKALDSYTKKWNEQLGRYMNEPLHNWASHGADALRYGAVTRPDTGARPAAKPVTRQQARWGA